MNRVKFKSYINKNKRLHESVNNDENRKIIPMIK